MMPPLLSYCGGRGGTVLITALWMVALMGVVIASFAVNTHLQTRFLGATDRLRTARGLALSGAKLWLQQMRAETLSQPRGVVLTEIMSHNPLFSPGSVTLNEIDPAARCRGVESVEIFNRSHSRAVDVSGWTLHENRGQFASLPSPSRLGPRQFRVLSGYGLNNAGDVLELRDRNGRVVDRFRYRSVPGAGESWQVLPDGRNGFKPASNRTQEDPAWTSRSCSPGKSNGRGLWLRLGNRRHEGVELRQHGSAGEVLRRFNFATDAADTLSLDDDYLDLSGGSAMVVLVPGDGSTDARPGGTDAPGRRVLWRGSGGAFPDFRHGGLRISVHEPRRLQKPGRSSRRFVNSDQPLQPPGLPDLRVLESFQGHRGVDWLVRVDASSDPGENPRLFLRGDSGARRLRAGDPGRFRPRAYEQHSTRAFALNDPGSIPPDKRGRLLVSEVGRIPGRGIDHLVITRLSADHHPEFVEVFNPHKRPLTLGGWREENGARQTGLGVRIPPGGYRLICDGDAGFLRLSDRRYRCDLNMESSLANPGEGFWIRTAENGVVDRVGDTGAKTEFREDEGVRVSGSFNLERRTSWGGYPRDTDRNQHDFREHVGARDLGRLGSGYRGDPTLHFVELFVSGVAKNRPGDPNEYIELYNTNRRQPVDVTGELRLIDHRDESFRPVDSSFRFDLHPADPNPDHGRLAPGQVGLVLHRGADTDGLGVSGAVDDGTVRAYMLRGPGGEPQFLSGGLHNDTQDVLTLRGNPGGPPEVAGPKNGSSPPVRARVARIKTSPDRGNDPSNWVYSSEGGSPGRVGGTDHFQRLWGWGGEWTIGVGMDQKLYLPSLSTARSGGDLGYVRVRSIEDETGKINLLVPRRQRPRDRFELTPEVPPRHRAVTENRARAIIRHNRRGDLGDWLTPGDFFTPGADGESLLAGTVRTWKRRLRIYTTYRIDPENHRLNVNTAPYEALRTLPIRSRYRRDDGANFLPHRVALEIMKRRSGRAPAPDEGGFYRSATAAYRHHRARPFSDPAEVCQLPAARSVPSFDCEVFTRHARTGSEGRFRVVVEGVVLDERGDTRATQRVEMVVDRRPLERGEGPLRVLYRRVH